MNSIRYFIPVDFSEASYRAIQYASLLAGRTSGAIQLGHIIPADEITESDNPVVVQWSLTRLEQKASDRMQSLKEIITGTGIPVKKEIGFGNVRSELLKMIERCAPDVIVLPRKTFENQNPGLFNYLSKNCRMPLLVVPESFVPQAPERAVVATDLRPENGELDTAFRLLSKSASEIELLNIQIDGAPAHPEKQDWITRLERKYGMDTRLQQHGGNSVVHGVISYLKSNPVDLLCTIRRNKNFITRALGESVADEIARQAEVPVLVIRE
ncbi:MAG: universal stress protein [Flammeovirgaceae bacterium]|nr:MAG: universal stress protein [Flammeovirgaceae bacterium]